MAEILLSKKEKKNKKHKTPPKNTLKETLSFPAELSILEGEGSHGCLTIVPVKRAGSCSQVVQRGPCGHRYRGSSTPLQYRRHFPMGRGQRKKTLNIWCEDGSGPLCPPLLGTHVWHPGGSKVWMVMSSLQYKEPRSQVCPTCIRAPTSGLCLPRDPPTPQSGYSPLTWAGR